MSDSQPPHDNPERDPAGPSAQGPVNGGPQPGAQGRPRPAAQPAAAQPAARSSVRFAGQPQSNGSSDATPDSNAQPEQHGRMEELLANRKLVWAVTALLCAAAGVLASVLGAHAVARSDSSKAQQSAQQTSAQIASTVKLALRHEEDIAVGAATYFAGNSKTSPKEFAVWVKWARTLRRYPELQGLSLVTLVHASELAAFDARITGQAVEACELDGLRRLNASSIRRLIDSAVSPTQPRRRPQRLRRRTAVPAARRPANPTPTTASRSPTWCAAPPRARRRASTTARRRRACCCLETRVEAATRRCSPAARRRSRSTCRCTGATSRRTACSDARRHRSAGCARCSRRAWCWRKRCAATRLPRCASATTRARRISRSRAAPPQPGAQSTTIELHNGWTVQSFAAASGTGVLSDGSALALLIVGCLLSALLGAADLRARRRARHRCWCECRSLASRPAEDLHDPLTGLPNRALMIDRAECMLARAGRQSGLLGGRAVHRHRLVQGRQRAARRGRGRPDPEDRRRAPRGRGARGRHGGPSRRRRVRAAGRDRRARGAPGLAGPARGRVAAQAVRTGRLRAELLPDGEHRRRVRSLRRLPTTCCATRSWRCTRPSPRARTATRCSTPTCAR